MAAIILLILHLQRRQWWQGLSLYREALLLSCLSALALVASLYAGELLQAVLYLAIIMHTLRSRALELELQRLRSAR